MYFRILYPFPYHQNIWSSEDTPSCVYNEEEKGLVYINRTSDNNTYHNKSFGLSIAKDFNYSGSYEIIKNFTVLHINDTNLTVYSDGIIMFNFSNLTVHNLIIFNNGILSINNISNLSIILRFDGNFTLNNLNFNVSNLSSFIYSGDYMFAGNLQVYGNNSSNIASITQMPGYCNGDTSFDETFSSSSNTKKSNQIMLTLYILIFSIFLLLQ